ncbi:MAG: NUDIX hydrolase [Polyangiaceae bacterium]|nr:NUDIX hydrolase [Polyangiaceae bacterium]
MPLPPLPKLALRLVEVIPSRDEPGFLNLRRQVLRVEFEDGSLSEPFIYDCVDRTRLDAVVIAPHYLDAAGRRHVFLRSALRPPVALRPLEVRPFPEAPTLGGLWELPAGLVELDEQSPEGLRRSAARELLEEVGIEVDPTALTPLGPSTFPAPGMIGERHFYFHVEVDPARRVTPSEDGSPLEMGAAIVELPLDVAIDLTRRGQIEDAKTELALRRLAEL